MRVLSPEGTKGIRVFLGNVEIIDHLISVNKVPKTFETEISNRDERKNRSRKDRGRQDLSVFSGYFVKLFVLFHH